MEAEYEVTALHRQLAKRVQEELHHDIHRSVELLEASLKRSVDAALGTFAPPISAASPPGLSDEKLAVAAQGALAQSVPSRGNAGRRANSSTGEYSERQPSREAGVSSVERIVPGGSEQITKVPKGTDSVQQPSCSTPAAPKTLDNCDSDSVDLTRIRTHTFNGSSHSSQKRKSFLKSALFSLHCNGLESFLERVEAIELMDEPVRHGVANTVISSGLFEVVTMTTIVLNAIFIACVEDYRSKHPKWSDQTIVKIIDVAFLTWYTIEIGLKMYVHKGFFFLGKDLRWNLFDLCLVVFGIIDFFIEAVSTKSIFNPLFIRGFRLMKLVNLFRTVRVLKVFTDLRMMLLGLVGSLLSLLWCIVMLVFTLYMFALVFLQGTATYFRDHFDLITGPNVDKVHADLKDWWTGLDRTMLTLYMAATGGEDWGAIWASLKPVGIEYQHLVVFFTLFFTFALINTVTAVYVDRLAKKSQSDDKVLLDDWRRIRKMEVETMSELVDNMDLDKSGSITRKEFESMSQTDTMIALLARLGIEVDDAEMLFRLLTNFSLSGHLEVDRDIFLNGLLKIKGRASAVDLHVLSYQVRLAQAATQHLKDRILPVLEELSQAVSRMRLQQPTGSWRQQGGQFSTCTDNQSPRRTGQEAIMVQV